MRSWPAVVSILALLGVARLAAAAVVVEKVGVEVAPLDPKGKPWDRGTVHAAPDPQIDIHLDGAKVKQCPAAMDTFTAECEAPDLAPSTTAIEISLRVDDSDHGFDERIGTARGVIPPDATGRIALEVNGKVVAAWVEVRQTSDPLVSPSTSWILGIAIGCALALLAGAALARAVSDEGTARRSPLLLAGTVAALAGLIVSAFVYRRATDPVFAAIPLALGTFCATGALFETVARRRLERARLRRLILGSMAILAVPALRMVGTTPLPDLVQLGLLVVVLSLAVLMALG